MKNYILLSIFLISFINVYCYEYCNDAPEDTIKAQSADIHNYVLNDFTLNPAFSGHNKRHDLNVSYSEFMPQINVAIWANPLGGTEIKTISALNNKTISYEAGLGKNNNLGIGAY